MSSWFRFSLGGEEEGKDGDKGLKKNHRERTGCGITKCSLIHTYILFTSLSRSLSLFIGGTFQLSFLPSPPLTPLPSLMNTLFIEPSDMNRAVCLLSFRKYHSVTAMVGTKTCSPSFSYHREIIKTKIIKIVAAQYIHRAC